MDSVFRSAGSFDSDLSKWSINKVTILANIFMNSGFDRTICGSKWSSLSAFSDGKGRSGCCNSGRYMSNYNLDPFVEANACTSCPVNTYACTKNSDVTCGGTVACAYNSDHGSDPLPDCTPSSAWTDRCGTRTIIDNYMAGGTAKTNVVDKYGEIQDWNMEQVVRHTFIMESFVFHLSQALMDCFTLLFFHNNTPLADEF